jgi:DNA helicase II / ATP-dependent DNA helicase PcrA
MAKYSAQQIYSVISQHQLTDEQAAVIQDASTSEPTLVIAGAGSGKTELMTLRILYLVANEFAQPEQILGLTFTKKAASELSARVLRSLYLLRESQLWPASVDYDFIPPRIATYNSFGNELFRAAALSLGFNPEAQLLGESGAVALAQELVASLDLMNHPELEDWELSVDYLVEKVLDFAAELTDNQLDGAHVQRYFLDFAAHLSGLPKTSGGSAERFAYTQQLIETAQQNALLVSLAQRYRELKRERDLVDFSDQIALALEVPGLVSEYRFVMLDEYQDTSAIQTRLLAKLFAGTAVMAVGDPNQSIYGWRGASEANLSGFQRDFGAGQILPLSTCWRSGDSIVAAANLVAEPLGGQGSLSPIRLKSIKKSESITATVYQSLEQEAQAAAEYFKAHLDAERSMALLMRTKSSMPTFVAALQYAGIPFEVSGLSGLLELPEVIDLVCALKVIGSTAASTELVRLLSGPKWSLSPAEIASLGRFAKKLSKIRPEAKGSPITLVEALDELRRDSSADLSEISPQALQRLRPAAELFHQMRTSLSLSISELAWLVVRELEIDIELYAHSSSAQPLSNLESFISKLSDYESNNLRPSLSGLLRWLDYATEHESFEVPSTGAKRGLVQVMSVHASKGLEWDVVLVAQLNQGSFPLDPKQTKGWLGLGKVPFELRADSSAWPQLDYRSADSQREIKQQLDYLQEQLREKYLTEERRLAYVAITRAAHTLRLTASYYKPGSKKPRAVSPFLLELSDAGLIKAEIPEPVAENPETGSSAVELWPTQPTWASQVRASADLVLEAKPITNLNEISLLLEERERNLKPVTPKFPRRLSASNLVRLLVDPAEFFESLARPLPPLYSELAALGTQFHLDVEGYLRTQDLDSLAELEQSELGKSFLGSRFANLEPVLVEQEIQFSLADLIVVCKLDAVFEIAGEFQIVDWKSGSAPSEEQLQQRSLQLALYRVALSKFLNLGPERISASFFFAGDGREITPEQIPGEAELIARIDQTRKAHLS